MKPTLISKNDSGLVVPDGPIIPFIEGDGIGIDIWPAAKRVLEAAVQKVYSGSKTIFWKEVLAGEKAFKATGEWLPDATLEVFRSHRVGIKGPLTTPVGAGIRSLNVALRLALDLYACVRPVRWYHGTPSPVKHPEKTDMVIFRENTEDIYAGVEFKDGEPGTLAFRKLFKSEFGDLYSRIRFPDSSGFGLKPISREGTQRLVAAALDFAFRFKRKSVTLVHKGNIMKFTEGAFRDWGYQLSKEQYGGIEKDGGPWQTIRKGNHEIIVKDVITDAFFQQILTRPLEYDVVATMNLNGDYISDALAAIVGGIGIAPGGNINYTTGHAIFEATHGTAPKYAGQDKVNPGSIILSGAMMFDYLGWEEASQCIHQGLQGAISNKRVTYDFERLMQGATLLKCSEFADEVIKNMDR